MRVRRARMNAAGRTALLAVVWNMMKPLITKKRSTPPESITTAKLACAAASPCAWISR